MKMRRKILVMTLAALLVSPVVGSAQDAAYITPSKARELRKEEDKKRAELEKVRAAQRAQRDAEDKQREEERLRAQEEYENNVSDWYNRRPSELSSEEMERNLDRLDGSRGDARKGQGGKYSQRIRRFSSDNDNVVVLRDVDRVYILDDMQYDYWSDSYYGRDWDRGVNISINVGPYWGWDRWSYYRPWYRHFYSWSYPWYDPWYDPWYYPSAWRWHRPHHHWGWGWTYSPWYGGHYGYNHGYWHGYYDGYWGGNWGGGSPNYNANRRTYSTYGRSAGGYYDRSPQSSEYGRALGQGIQTRNANTRSNGYYDRGSTTRSTNNNNRTTTNSSRRWDRGQSSNTNRSRSWTSPSTTRSNSGGSYSAPSRSNSGGGGSNSRSSGSSRRTR